MGPYIAVEEVFQVKIVRTQTIRFLSETLQVFLDQTRE